MGNQSIIPLFIAGSLLLTLFAFFLVAYLLVQKRKQNRYQMEKQQMIFDHETSLLRTKIEEQENTMDQISKELHDNVKSLLGFAQMTMYRIADMAASPEQAAQVEKTNQIIGQAIDDIHNLSHSLNSNFIRHIGLLETITKDLEGIRAAKNIVYEVEVKGEPFSLNPEKELHIYRIAQEAIQNGIRHGKATKLIFTAEYTPRSFIMSIRDNGVGFDKNKIFDMKGLGFLNMFQRARYVQGSIEVQTAPQQGSTIVLTVNLDTDGWIN